MLAQHNKPGRAEPETLRRHREMYEDRMRHLRLTQGKSEKEMSDKANDPEVFRKAADTVGEHDHASVPPRK
jgi:hypothetical protein